MFVRRYAGLYVALAALVVAGVWWARGTIGWGWALACLAVCLLGIHDISQRRHSLLRNYPILVHVRFLFERIRPELRQYIVESETEEAPFSRAQRSVVYQRAKNDVDFRAFGMELKLRESGHEWINHSCCFASVRRRSLPNEFVAGERAADPRVLGESQ